MAKVRVISNPLRKGRVGADTFYVSKGVQIVRPSRNVSNYGETARRSEAQQDRRVKWANLVSIYKLSKFYMSAAFETKTPNQSDYNKFMAVNVGSSHVNLTKEEAEQGACVIEPVVVSMGSLQSLTGTISARVLSTGLNCEVSGDLPSLVKGLSSILLAQNPWMKEGMQISVILYEQVVEDGIPRAYMSVSEMTIDRTDESSLSEHFRDVHLAAVNNELVINLPASGNGGAVALLSYSADGGGIKVSTQRIALYGSQDVYNEYTSSEAAAQARESYGEDAEHFLESGDLPN